MKTECHRPRNKFRWFRIFLLGLVTSSTCAIYRGSTANKQNHLSSFVHFATRDIHGHLYHTCGGVLIAWDKVLTAAHCSIKENDLAYLGTSHLLDTSREGLILQVKKVENHPQFLNGLHDLAIVVLRMPSRTYLSHFSIEPVNIDWNFSRWYPKQIINLQVMGFGGTEALVRPKIPSRLQIGESFTTHPQVCRGKYITSTNPKEIICFDAEFGGAVACKGDSGSPIGYLRENQWHLVGIVEAGEPDIRTCIPGEKWTAINVEAYRTWIESVAGRQI